VKGLLFLFAFLALIALAALYQVIRIYIEVFQDLQMREFSDSAIRNLWIFFIVLLPPVGGLIYHAVYIYEPPWPSA